MTSERIEKEKGNDFSNEQLVTRIQAGENVKSNMEQLYLQMYRFIRMVAAQYAGLENEEDLQQEGALALYDAVENYDPVRDVPFLNYAAYWIRQRIRRYIINHSCCLRIPEAQADKIRKYERWCIDYAAIYGRNPSEEEAACAFGITLLQIRQIQRDSVMAHLGSLDAPVLGLEGEEDAKAGDFIPTAESLENEAIERIDAEMLRKVLWECVDSLPDQLPEVIRRRYQGGEPLRQIGEEIGLSVERVRQMEGKALRGLREPSRAKKLRPFFPEADRIYNSALRGVRAGAFKRTWTSSTEREALRLVESTEDFLKREREETERILIEAKAEKKMLF